MMDPEIRADWIELKNDEIRHRSNLDQWWREMEQFKEPLETLLEAMPKEGSVIRSMLMLCLLQLSTNMLGRQLDEMDT